jgi:hypothetical protein
MLKAVTAQQFLKRMGSGKTKPCLIGCAELSADPAADAEEDAPAEFELVVKFSDGCESKKRGLVAEALAALLAADLGLPVPEPFLVQIEPEFVSAIPDTEIQALARRSLPWAFGCAKLPPQFATVATGISLPPALIPQAAEILAFDLLIANSDRRAQNPNCLFNGKELAIYDHELALLTEGVLFWKPPWEEGGVSFVFGEDRHLFLDVVRGISHDFSRLQSALEAITPGRVEEYRWSLPEEWGREDDATDRMVAYIQQLRSHAAVALQQIQTSLR